MGTLTIRNLEDQVIERLKDKARQNGRSLEAEVREALRYEAERMTRKEAVAESDRLRAMTPKGVKQTDSVELLRQGREERMRRLLSDGKPKSEGKAKKYARRR
jgi:plasmid stability protein